MVIIFNRNRLYSFLVTKHLQQIVIVIDVKQTSSIAMLRQNKIIFISRRWKHGRDHWSMIDKKKRPIDRALTNFDDFYGSVFGNRWRGIRAALLTEHKYIALVNNFGDTEETREKLELGGAINVRLLFNSTKERLAYAKPEGASESTNQYLDKKLDSFIREQQEQEIASIYPQNTNELTAPPEIQFRETDGSQNASQSAASYDFERVDPKKSLSETIEENSELDLQRLVDPEHGGVGALHEFVPANRIKGMEDWIPESEHYKYYSTTTDFPLTIEPDDDLVFPENLHLYGYEKGNCSVFPRPRNSETKVLTHFLMDGASVLPPLFLDVKYGERVLDACAAPGGKSLLMLQTLHPDLLICNDIQESRTNRIKRIMEQYIFDYDEKWHKKKCLITQSDARNIDDYELYDKILVDVPCTTDRHSVMESNNNIFKPSRVKERLRLPEMQAAILSNCLRLLKPGGSLVYATCSLSPIQNDGVVHMSLQKTFNENGITATIKDLSRQVRFFGQLFRFENPKNLKYGQMVLPYLPANFGPMYFCKMIRNK